MTSNEYLQCQTQIGLIDQIVSTMPLDDFLSMARHADSVGSIIDPTLYRDGADALHAVIRRAEALAAFKRTCGEAVTQ